MPSTITNRRVTITGVTTTTPFTNEYSYLFDGVNERININSIQAILAGTTQGTWSFRIKPVNALPASPQVLLSFGTGAVTDLIQLYINNITGLLIIDVLDNGAFLWRLTTNSAPFSNNTWAQVGVVQDGINAVIYINGVAPAQEFTISTNLTFWFNNLVLNNGRIGCRSIGNPGDGELPFNGNIDEARFWNRAFSAAEMLDDYNSGTPKAPNTVGLVGNFRMGDGDTWDGTNWTLIDTVNGNNGTSVMMEEADRTLDTP